MKLSYKFENPDLLTTALSNYSNDPQIRNQRQRLEFLGDRVLSLVLGEELLKFYEAKPVGFIVATYNNLVNNHHVRKVSRKIGLDTGEIGQKALADCCEALIGAIFMDGGLKEAKKFVLTHWQDAILDTASTLRDAKSLVQEWSQKEYAQLPQYNLVEESGEDHKKQFMIEIKIGDTIFLGTGTSKKVAEQAAAEAFLNRSKN